MAATTTSKSSDAKAEAKAATEDVKSAASEATSAGSSALEALIARVRGAGEQVRAGVQASSNQAIDSYDQGLERLVGLEYKAAELSPVPLVKDLTVAHADYVKQVGTAYAKAARDLVN